MFSVMQTSTRLPSTQRAANKLRSIREASIAVSHFNPNYMANHIQRFPSHLRLN